MWYNTDDDDTLKSIEGCSLVTQTVQQYDQTVKSFPKDHLRLRSSQPEYDVMDSIYVTTILPDDALPKQRVGHISYPSLVNNFDSTRSLAWIGLPSFEKSKPSADEARKTVEKIMKDLKQKKFQAAVYGRRIRVLAPADLTQDKDCVRMLATISKVNGCKMYTDARPDDLVSPALAGSIVRQEAMRQQMREAKSKTVKLYAVTTSAISPGKDRIWQEILTAFPQTKILATNAEKATASVVGIETEEDVAASLVGKCFDVNRFCSVKIVNREEYLDRYMVRTVMPTGGEPPDTL
jgi:hypothetical protein